MLVSVQNVSKGFLDDVVLQNVSVEIHAKDRIGLLGVNGVGKTTLLNLISGSLEADSGQILRARGLEIGYLRQNDTLQAGRSLEEEAHSAFAAAEETQNRLDTCFAALAEAPEDEDLLAECGLLQDRLSAMDAYQIDLKIDRVLTGLGFGSFPRSTLVDTLSGGEKMRFGIAKMLLRSPGLLILDEPTNHLDFTMLNWLEGYLLGYPGAVLTVSHDRYFLDKVTVSICELERGKLSRYTGGYSGFIQQKEERRLVEERAYEKQQEDIAAMEDYVRRNQARASTAGMASSRAKALEKMVRLEKPPPAGRGISLRFDYDVEPFLSVLTCENLSATVGEGSGMRTLFSGLELEMQRGEKLALVGPNGVGKSTFLKAIQGLFPHGGLAHWGGNVRVGYFDQELAGLPLHKTVLEAVHSVYPAKTEHEIRSALGRMLITGEDVYKKVQELSGANRAKVAFTILQMRRANLLLMDEPTNHLDYRAKEELEMVLRQYPGSLLVVSHDRYFLRQVPSCILELTTEGFIRYNGNYDAYLEQKQAAEGTVAARPRPANDKPKAQNPKERRAAEAQKRNQLRALEEELSTLENAVATARAALQDPQNGSDYELLASLSTQLEADTARLEVISEEWLTFEDD